MLGMMNSASDSVEFYATNRKVSGEMNLANGGDLDADLQKFSEVKQKDVVTYTEDGRKLINGKLMTESDPHHLWSSALLRGRIHQISVATPAKAKNEQEREKERRNSKKKLVNTIAVVASLQTMAPSDVIGHEPDVPTPVEVTQNQ